MLGTPAYSIYAGKLAAVDRALVADGRLRLLADRGRRRGARRCGRRPLARRRRSATRFWCSSSTGSWRWRAGERRASVHLLHVCGARPNFMKVAPVMAAVEAWNASRDGQAGDAPSSFAQTLVHTGQHYDAGMSDVFFRAARAAGARPPPRCRLGLARRPDGRTCCERLEPVLLRGAPRPRRGRRRRELHARRRALRGEAAASRWRTSRPACAAATATCPRSSTGCSPTSSPTCCSRPSASAGENLAREGIDAARVHFVGNTMIDTLERLLPRARAGDALARLGLAARGYALVTLHRPSNVDDAGAARRRWWARCAAIAERLPVVWPVHPRTRARLGELRRSTAGAGEQPAASCSPSRSATSTSCSSWTAPAWCSPTRAASRRRPRCSACPA